MTNRSRSKAPKRCVHGHHYTEENTYYSLRDGGRSCKECRRIRRRNYVCSDPMREKQRSRIKNLRKYGLTLDDYNELLESQGGGCAICGKHGVRAESYWSEERLLAVDHNHVTGRVRGLLCDSCNRGMGLLKDSEQILARAAKYLTQ